MKPPLYIDRREFSRLAAGLAGLSFSNWFGQLAACAAAEPARRRKSCILLWLDGGPSHIDTFDPKPDAGVEVRGDLTAIDTATPGIRLAEKFPNLAKQMQHAAIVRTLSTDVVDHIRARVFVHTGYKPSPGLSYPGLGSLVSAELGAADAPLPNFVACGTPRSTAGSTYLDDPGYLGPRHSPLLVTDALEGVSNLRARAAERDFRQRFGVLDQLNASFQSTRPVQAAAAHRAAYQRAVTLMHSEKNLAFDLSQEPASALDKYGPGDFGAGCLLARRLVEAGVPFVEVYSRDWDSHDAAASNRLKESTMPALDRALGALLNELDERGLLSDTLVLCLGEFGRTPRINAGGGRDHYSTAFSAVLAGGGVRGGQVLGKTSADGAAILDRPVTMVDFMATVCTLLGIDFRKRYETPGMREVPIVDLLTQAEPKVLRELL